MYRMFKQRIAVLGFLALIFLVVYGIARHYSPAIVAYVVEQTLIQKAPQGISLALVQERFEASLASTPPEARMMKLLALSNYLEKIQKLTPVELDRLLKSGGTAFSTNS
ncbi:MAG: hypothetical protein ABSH28_06535 [Acidobacteriota bacterium]|jgi:hypothetical protein